MILLYPNKLLLEPCAAVTEALDPEFLQKMWVAMQRGRGVGLAAPQVGVLQRFFIADTGEGLETFVNPRWCPEKSDEDRFLRQEPRKKTLLEGCLSFPNAAAGVQRYTAIRAQWQNQNLEPQEAVLTDFRAQVFQHESDHLNGVLFIKHLTAAERSRIVGNAMTFRRRYGTKT
jgi:peptide deformylase